MFRETTLRRLFLRAWLLLGILLVSFPALAAAPTATTSPATAITTSSGQLNGAGTPNGEGAIGWFRISATNPGTCNDSFGTRVPATEGTDLGSGTASVPYSINATGLTSGLTYYFCAIVENASGKAFGAVLSFTVPGAPSVTTTGTSDVTETTATLEGSAAPNAAATTGYFRFSLTDPGTCNDTFGTRAPVSGGSNLGSGSSPVDYTRTLSGLTPGATYYFCAIAQNAHGTSFGAVESFTALAAAPVVTTSSATLVTGNTAQLNGAANPGGADTTGWFRFGTSHPGSCNDSFGTRAPTTGGSLLGAGNSSVAYSIGVTGLSAATTYYYCAIAENAVGKSFGAVVSFTTPSPPAITTTAATNLTNTGARLNGSGVPNGAATTGWFRYSATNPGACDDVFGSRAPISGGTSLGSGSASANFFQTIGGLSAGTTYYFCAIGQNSEGLAFGTVLTFTTADAPTVETSAASLVSSSSATLNGAANPNGNAAFGYFRYSATNPGTCNDSFGTRLPSSSSFDTSLGAGASSVAYGQALSGLSPGTTYFFCAIGRNAYGTRFGAVMSFTTEAALPTVSTQSANLLTGSTGELRGTANPGGADTTGWFRYATTSPGTCNDSFGTRAPASSGSALGSGISSVAFNESITGLTAGTTYYYCAIAENAVGKSFGAVVSFTTPLPPTVTTTAVSNLTNTGARLNGTGVPNGATTTGWFRYSATDPGTCNDTFGSRAPATGGSSLGAGNSGVAYFQNLTGLTAGTTYYYCAIVSSTEGTAFGAVLSFTTADVPSVATAASTLVTSSAATLNGSANPNFNSAFGYFRYSTSNPGTCNDAFGTRVPSSTTFDAALGAGASPVAYSFALTGLSPGTTYYYCALGRNSFGTSFGAVMSFTTLAALPTVSTQSANLLTGSSANLRGAANPGGAATTGWFRYATTSPGSCNDTFGTRAPTTAGSALGSGTASVAFNEEITGLSPATTYFYCAIAENSEGKAFGAVVSFTTPTPPTVTTTAATNITNGGARLNGTGNPNGSAATGWFRFSLTDPGTCNDTFGSRAPTTGGTSLGAGSSAVSYNTTLTGLSAGTTYYYCAIASSAEGTAFGAVLTFITADAPSVTTVDASAITSNAATLEGSANPNGNAAFGFFRYSATNPVTCNDSFGTRVPSSTSFDTSLGAGSSGVPYSSALSGLLPGTTYYYCALARNGYGTRFGAVMSFTTDAALPAVTTQSPTLVTGTGATLRGAANPGGAATTGWFRYATASPGSCNDTFGTRAPVTGGDALGSGTSSVAFDEAITGLSPGTTYYVCAIAESSVGKTFGAVVTFTTPLPPTATTTAATNLTNVGARLNGAGVPNGAATTGWFRFSATHPGTCNDTFGSRAPTTGGTSLGTGSTATTYFTSVTGLTAGTTYYFCAIVSSTEGVAFGEVLTFTTASAPSVSTAAAAPVTSSSATLNAEASPNNNSAFGYFRFGTTDPGTCNDSFGTRLPSSSSFDASLGAGASPVAFSHTASSLQPGTTYFYCAIARNSYGTSFGAVMSFTTDAVPPSVTTSTANLLTGTTANLRGSANPGGAATTGWFRYAATSPGSCNDSFGTRAPTTGGAPLGAGTSSVAFAEGITGLSPGTTYYFCAIAENGLGKAFGTVSSFTTPTPPVATTQDATNLTNSGARLNGTGTPNGASSTGWFRYALTDPGTCNDTFGSRAPLSGGSSLGAVTTAVSYFQNVSGLSAGTTYFYCAIVSSAEGTSFGEVLSFTTAAAPSVTTAAATGVTSNAATLQGSANPNNNAAFGYFRYSTANPGACNDSFGTRAPSSSTSDTSLGAGNGSVAFQRAISGLSPGTTYFYCAIARNSYGTSFGAVMSLTTPAAPPAVTTSSPTGVSTTGATLRGSGNPGGDATVGWFRFATASPGTCNDSFGTRAPTASGSSLGSGISSVAFSEAITGLLPGTTYYYCAIAQNSVGLAFGSVLSFTTTSPPAVSTFAATPVTSTTATLNASVNPNGFAASGWFRYGTSDPGACNSTFGTATTTTALGSGSTAVALTASLTGLSPATTYYFCAIAQSTQGTTLGAVLSFTTPAAPPSVTTNAPSDVLDTSALLAGTVNPNGSATTAWFRYSATNPGTCNDAFGTREPATGGAALGAGNSPVDVSMPISSLAAGTTYYFCALASSAIGNSVGTVVSFTTPEAPTVTSAAATAVGSTSATLQGSADPNNSATTGWFRYGTTNPGTCNDTFGTRAPSSGGTALGSGAVAVAFSEPLTGLSPATTYFFCAIAENAVGIRFGAVLSFTTTSAPSVTTSAATLVTSTSATLNGSADPNATATTGWFRYGTTNPGTCDDTFGTRAPSSGGTALGSGSGPVAYLQALTGLSAGTTYYFCAIAENAVGVAFGSVLSFTTPGAPTVTTQAAASITPSTATLAGAANPNLAATTGWFRFSSTNPGSCNDTFGTRAPASGGAALGAGSAAVAFTEPLTGLSPATTYYFCAIAQNSEGLRFGTVLSFSTTAAPSVTSAAASLVTSTGATLNGSANPNSSAATGWFRYSTSNPGSCNDTFGTRAPLADGDALGAGTSPVAFSEALTGLAINTTYYFCAIAQNAVGTSFGAVLSFTTTAAPTVTTTTASTVTSTSATLEGSANPNLAATTGWFRYSATDPGACDDSFGTRAPVAGGDALGAGSSAVAFSEAITGLSPATTYYFCAIADNAIGTSFGAVLSFTTPAAPAVTSLAPSAVTSASATLEGSANPNFSAATGWFRYSATNPGTCNDSFGTRAPAVGGSALGAGSTAVLYSQAITGLSAGTTYYFCAIAQNGVGTTFGAVLTFTTPATPSVTSVAATAVTSTSASLNGSANPNSEATTGWFRYSATNPGACDDTFGDRVPATGGAALGAGSSAVAFDEALTGLSAGTTYYFCAIAENAVGTAFGALLTFTTTSAPSVTTTAASSVASTTATLNGSANPNLAATTAWFRYATVDPGTCDDVFGTRAPAADGSLLGAGSSLVTFDEAITGLSPATTYYFCAIAENAVGKRFGAVLSFTTTAAPTVTSSAATTVTDTTATLNGTANPNLSATTAWYRYSAVDPGACNDTFGTRAPGSGGSALGAGQTAVAFTQGLTGLSAGTTYYFCAIAENAVGKRFGAVLSFTTTAAPTVTTAAATAVTSTSATLQGSADPNLSAATGWFRYSTSNPGSCNDTFGTRAPTSSGATLGAGSSPVAFSQALTGLTSATTYYFCAIAENAVGKRFGAVLSFTTTGEPAVTTAAATSVTDTAATLNGSANPNLNAATGWFRYSATDPGACDDTFGTRAPTASGTALGAGSAAVAFSESLTGLSPGTTYYFCAIAQNGVGTAFGAVLSFTTAGAPTVTTEAALATSTTASLNGNANPNLLASTGWFRYDVTAPGACDDTFGVRVPLTGGTALGAGSSPVAFSEALTGLSPATTYYYCAIASNGAGTSFGAVMSFTTLGAPTVTTNAASDVTSASASLHGSANPNLLASTGWFRYDVTDPGTCDDTFGTRAPATGGTDLGAGDSDEPFTEAITGLLPGTTYYFCAIADNAEGTSFGAVESLTTEPEAPVVETDPPTNVTATAAELNGAADPSGADTLGWFRFDTTDPGACDDAFGTRAPAADGFALGATAGIAVTFSETVTSLTPGATYFYCAIAENTEGISFGEVVTFVAGADAPTVTTGEATDILGVSATLTGTANPNGSDTAAWFRYGDFDPGVCDDSFGMRSPSPELALGDGFDPVAMTTELAGLEPSTTYFYCAAASNLGGASFGEVRSFTTLGPPPEVVTVPALSVGRTVQLNGEANPLGTETTAWFRYDTAAPAACDDTFGARFPESGGTVVGDGTSRVAYSETLSELAPGTYYFCAIAESAAGMGFGEVLSFVVEGPPSDEEPPPEEDCSCSTPGAGDAGNPSKWLVALCALGLVRRRRVRPAGSR